MRKLFISSMIFLLPFSEVFAVTDSVYYQSLSDEDKSTISLIQKVNPSVVSIVGKKNVERRVVQCFVIINGICLRSWNEQNDRVESGESVFVKGSGFLIHERGLIVTNKHVVSQPDLTYEIMTLDGKRYTAKVLKRSDVDDTALLHIQGNNFPALHLGNSDSLMIGQSALAIGNTLGEYQNTVTKGIVSGLDRNLTASDGDGSNVETLSGLIQTSASISSGNSGWPLIDSAGNVIGMNTAVDISGQNIGFALPSNRIRDFLRGYVQSVKK